MILNDHKSVIIVGIMRHKKPQLSLVCGLVLSLLLIIAIQLDGCDCFEQPSQISLPELKSNASLASPPGSHQRRVELLGQTIRYLREKAKQQQLYEAMVTTEAAAATTITPPSASRTQTYRHETGDPSLSPIKRGYIEDPSMSRRDPKYMNACNRPRDLDPPSSKPTRALPAVSNFTRHLAAAKRRLSSSSSSELERSKRAIVWHSENSLDSQTPDDKGLVHVRNPKNSASAKQTSFIMSSRAHHHRRHHQHRYHNLLSPEASSNKNRYFYSSATLDGHHQGALAIGEESQERNQTAELTTLIDDIKATDLRVLWLMNCIRNTIHQIRLMPGSFIRQIDRELASKGLAPVSEESLRKVDDQLRAWMPSVKSLHSNITTTSGAQRQDSREALNNLRYEMQFFNMILEQMVYEQVAVDVKFASIYKDLERALLKILCDLENLSSLFAHLDETVKKLESQRQRANSSPPLMNRSGAGDEQILQSITRRLKQSVGHFASPIERLIGGSMLRKIDNDFYLKRELMPFEHRHQTSYLERLLRAQNVFRDLSSLLGYLEAILAELS